VAKFGPLTILPLVRELRAGSGAWRPIVVAGARELVPLLAKELRAGGDPTAVREGGRPEDASVFVWIGKPDEAALRAASRARVPIVGVTDGESLPYVLDTNLVFVTAGEGMPVDAVARRIAAVLGELATGPAARLPAMREAIVEELIRSFSRRNALVGAAVWVPGADLPLLTLNQIRLVLRIALAHGEEIDASRVPELAGVVGAGFALRTLARQLLGFVPVAGWIVKGGVAYAGTRAIGEAAWQYFGSVRPGS
jgi:uncharacterized protein (DUF697 family)